MLLGTLKMIASLCVIFHTCVCSVMQEDPEDGQKQDYSVPTRKKSTLLSATCGEYFYDKQMIYATIDEAIYSVPYLLQAKAIPEEEVTYVPSQGEKIRFQPPYYFYMIVRDRPSPINENQKDFVIITRDGRLVKVISQIRYSIPQAPGFAWRKEDCKLDFEKAPRARGRRLQVVTF